jgi:hypothetical protein
VGYEYDVFVSYTRTTNVQNWVRNHLVPTLHRALDDELASEPRVFLDTGIEAGERWPEKLEWALHRSRLLLPVWSPKYFRSRWCLAEWRTMLRREEALGISGPRAVGGLVYPVVFSDGDSFPPEACEVQQERSFKEWTFPYPQFAETPRYLDFHIAVGELAGRLAARLVAVPPWQEGWPSEFPEPPGPAPAGIPRL